MTLQDVALNDRYDLGKSPVLLNGTQALVRLMLMQAARDRAAGHRTAGYVTGYRGSPLGAVDMQMTRAAEALRGADILFQPGLNEDLAATALWGTQQAALRGEGRVEGVFGLWYGKGPGVDRSGDALRHAQMAGTAALGGVVAALGDDHVGESSTTCHQSDYAMLDAQIPLLSPAGVQEILDYGLYGFALSRYSGLWAGLKLMKDTVEATAIVDGRPDRMAFVQPGLALPEGGLGIRRGDGWVAQEERLVRYKVPAAEAFAAANGIDRRVHGQRGATIGLVAAGKSWLDLVHALDLLGIDEARAAALGITTRKIGQVWPIDRSGLRDWAEGLRLIVVVEEKRKLIEGQIAQALFGRDLRLYGGMAGERPLFAAHGALDPVDIAAELGALLIAEGRDSLRPALERITAMRAAPDAPDLAARLPYFCAGCPHNSSTRVPEGARAGAGIGCHTMALWMDRATEGYTQMGGEGATWIGEAPFSTRAHVFQNLGDGTYNHSGLLAIRAALLAGVNITYKILFNDAVAMTGGQANDGGLTPARILHEVAAMGVQHLALVTDDKEPVDPAGLPAGVLCRERGDLMAVQRDFATRPGVSVIVYAQTCAAEKRRRRKRGQFPAADRRVFINPDICEGCGDCGVQSNCVAILPLETEFGRKRQIDQSACNADYSCVNGFCPAFVTVTGATPRRPAAAALELPVLPDPVLPAIRGTWNVLITGIGGTGAVTVGATLAMAAHLESRGAAMIEMAGLAQKGGAVQIHLRLAETPAAISAIRLGPGEADAVLGGDLVTTATARSRALMQGGRTGAVVNAAEVLTGAFTRDPGFCLPGADLRGQIAARLGSGARFVEASALAERYLGDSIYANSVLVGAAWQAGLIPLSRAAILRAMALNGAAVAANQRAFEIGRWALCHPEAAQPAPPPAPTPEARIAARVAHLTAYQSARLARRYLALVNRFEDPELREAVALGYHKLLAYKDEYEVARLMQTTPARVADLFEGDLRLTWHLVPPLLRGAERPPKRAFGPWIARLWPWLARGKWLRGTPFDPFGYSAERRLERRLIRDYQRDMAELAARPLSGAARAAALELARLPLEIRGFGPVKQAAAERAALRRDSLRATLAAPAPQERAA